MSSHSDDENLEISSRSGSVLDESPAPTPDLEPTGAGQDPLDSGAFPDDISEDNLPASDDLVVPFDRIKSVPNFSVHPSREAEAMMHRCSIDASEAPSTSAGSKDQTSKAGTLTSSNSSRKQLPWDNMQQWLYCVVIVTFDVELGQTIEVCNESVSYVYRNILFTEI